MSTLWLSIEPRPAETRLLLSQPAEGTALRARLPTLPEQPRALRLLLEGLAAWYGQPLCAVLDADAEDVLRHPERWSHLLGNLDGEHVRVQWVGHSRATHFRDRFVGGTLGDSHTARRLLTFAATGLR
jgi:hypothetical protein